MKMGADLYIRNMEREPQYTGFEVSERAVDLGYFRDAYNRCGLFSVMSQCLGKSFSWWYERERREFFDDEGNMTVDGAKAWLKELTPHIEKFQQLNIMVIRTYNGKNIRLSEEEMAFQKQHASLLVRFLELAIRKESPIIWSV
jgi:hypothetical protein